MSSPETFHHKRLKCGIEFGALDIPGRRTTAFELRVLAGTAHEPAEHLGLARLVEETIGKGTARRSAKEFSNALDMIGAQRSSGVGRESTVFRCSCLPEFLEPAIELYSEMLHTALYPDEFCRVAVDLAAQELTALEDDPGELSRKLISPQAYGPRLGRHELGTRETLSRIGRNEIVGYWKQWYRPQNIQFVVGGAFELDRLEAQLNRLFGDSSGSPSQNDGPALEFSAGRHHQDKQLEQQHMLLCWPGVSVAEADYPVEHLMIAVLGDGMSSRLFTEVREKLGLVYWVGAWDEHPRKGGLVFIGASTTPARCEQTLQTILREVDRLADDVTEAELQRAKIGVIAKTKTHGEITRARVSELGSDLYYYGKPVSPEQKVRQISAVSVADVKRYLAEHPRDKLCVQTLGPAGMEGSTS
jgi:predicted Zn-dependent peptidase